ncbi:MAG TPA: hypothetical protein VJ873_14250 [bacterium]|nr:hypothetical protein [bacterium]
MKIKFGFFLSVPLLLLSCAGPPTLSKSSTTDTLSFSVIGTTSATGTGGFYDYSLPSTVISGGVTTINSYTETPISFPGGPFSFSDYTHDTLGFSITITGGPVTFSYQLDTVSQAVTVTTTYTSGRTSF